MEALLTVIALLFVLCVALGVYATVKVVGTAKRGVDRTIAQARRTVEDTGLRAKSLAQPGPAGEIASLRLALRTSMRATQEALHAGAGADESLKESLGLFHRLSAHGRELDAELRRLETEPDRSALARRLPELRERTERITGSADSLRWAAHDRAHRFADDDLDMLSAQIDLEAGALRHWTRERPEPSASTWPGPPATGTPATGPAAEAADGGIRPETAESRPAREADRPALGPRGQRPAYAWQKKPRPERAP
ncbi:hypothetical protein AB0C59_08325 [Streptomyces sp. NPDC048664]|uniref:hypothetical protein n=1 Tax=Streptomyces sp. NPDC048664 TaxID=3154505 RepID=UPI003432FBFE